MSHRFDFVETSLSGVYRVNRNPIVDSRGFFSRFFCAEQFKDVGLGKPIAQINHTLTRQKGTIRGMHFQFPPDTEAKLVTCLQGKVFDVAVDIRKGSSTFLQWHAETLSGDNQSSLYIPEGFAHGFQTLTDDCQLLYLHTASYVADSEGAVNPMDAMLAIDWPLEVTNMSDRDRNHVMLDSRFEGVFIE